MRTLLLSILLICPIKAVIGQSVFTMPNKSKEPQEEVIKFDSLHNIRFASTYEIDELKDFEQYIGQEIIFYGFGANLKDKAEGYINFEAEPTIVRCDTVWLKHKKKVKPEHYTIDTMYSRKYRPTYFEEANIRDCSSIISIYPEHSFSWDRWKPFTGYATSIEDIANKRFTIVDFHRKKSNTELYITLKDQKGNELYWIVNYHGMHSRIYDWNMGEACWPVVAKGYMDKMSQLYLNTEFFYAGNNKNHASYIKTITLDTAGERYELSAKTIYKFKELVYVDIFGTYSVPCFLIEDSAKRELFIPLCRMPEYTKFGRDKVYKPENDFGEQWAYMEDLIFKSVDAVREEQRAEEQRAEEQRQRKAEAEAREQQLQKAIMRQRAIEAANRKADLTKRYDAEIASLIVAEKVRIGMSEEMCRESWGEPTDINRSTGSWGVHEQWVYDDSNYLYFEDGILTSIQN